MCFLTSIVLKKQKEMCQTIKTVICLQFYFLFNLRVHQIKLLSEPPPSGGHFDAKLPYLSLCCMHGQRFYLFSHSPWDNKKGRTKNGIDLRIGS
jgi:hypothetical protein